MKVSKVRLYHVRMPLRSHFETSFGRSITRDCVLIEISTDGIVGHGECVADHDPVYSYETVNTAWHILSDFIIPKLIGTELLSPTDFPALVSGIRGHQMAKAGLEMALWDVYGKQQGISLSKLLGGSRSQVEVGVSVGIQETISQLIKVVEGYLVQGYRRVKIKIKPGRDVAETRAMRSNFPGLRLQVDANSSYSQENMFQLKAIDDLDLLMIEQPLADDDLWDHRRLQAQMTTSICLDESIITPRHARQAIEMQACRVINIKSGRVGGLTNSLAIHNLCLPLGIPVWCGGMLETGVGRAANLALASLPGFTLPGDISATERYYIEDITEQCFTLNSDSTIAVPTDPGLGITINHHSLKKVTLRQQTFL